MSLSSECLDNQTYLFVSDAVDWWTMATPIRARVKFTQDKWLLRCNICHVMCCFHVRALVHRHASLSIEKHGNDFWWSTVRENVNRETDSRDVIRSARYSEFSPTLYRRTSWPRFLIQGKRCLKTRAQTFKRYILSPALCTLKKPYFQKRKKRLRVCNHSATL